MRRPLAVRSLLAATVVVTFLSALPVRADCTGMAPTLGNVSWGFDDFLTACPAGDSVFAGHPARLCISVVYEDANCNPRAKVPPE